MPAPFTDLIGTDSFTESLRQENIATWLSATNHRFVAELFDGSIARRSWRATWCRTTASWTRSSP